MKGAKIIAIAVVGYVGAVVAFESFFGFFQPTNIGPTLAITTYDREGVSYDRVLSRLETDGEIYVAANHWPRAWYKRALENPVVQISVDGEKRNYRAVPVIGRERDRVEEEHRMPLIARVLSGFAPRNFLRLAPRSGKASGPPN